MKAIITGMNGTVAPVVATTLERHGIEPIAWDRSKVSIEKESDMRAFIESVQPDYFLHIGMGPVESAANLARLCGEYDIPFLFTSTVSVFSDNVTGPITPDTRPDAEDEYGSYKRACEQAIARANPGAQIVRLGWQIGDRPGSNNMMDFFEKEMEQKGVIVASTHWYPSCSFLQDTADALFDILTKRGPGMYQLNGNTSHSLYDIASALAERHDRPWRIERADEPKRDNRMVDTNCRIAPITNRLALHTK
ncbi:MAG: sugar nucleotide-binding protein [Exiguobacterium sp.]|uniref:dTDP-4-dehydrorhamnose reductase n=1 Tax=Exiguobacterium alkaliphilum TaxID=1428684 RepID=A0ABT2KW40_9BACL|nr:MULTISPECIES: sugar nucleotide-binding protein [Exiguobacterium]MDX5322301.1 sugar nucleotide-binding protein [Exiguobacterium sp.]KDN58413.1 epimerase [Exiguobacterium sp. AB2]MCT4794244.1 sugar nucleotide-binding protein [Exiguobacterium alkaliphilum]MDX5424023.1 sugar nucleotide-binding protein [Exiguobacterium sp.]MDX6771548.1 sugar nucleotide-binding protein [Exiguobacterium sp.]